MRGPWYADVVDYNPMYFALINGQKGFEREQQWRFGRYLANGAMNPALADPKGEIAKYEVVLNKYPNDSRGLGVLTIQYTDARLPDVYAYVRSVRRVRRLSSNAWADPLSSTDLLNDESFGMNAGPVLVQGVEAGRQALDPGIRPFQAWRFDPPPAPAQRASR